MSRFWIVLTIWFFCLMAGVVLAVWLHNKDQGRIDWGPGFIGTAREKVSHLYKKLRATINTKKLSKLWRKFIREAEH